jgi:hypothetical protein
MAHVKFLQTFLCFSLALFYVKYLGQKNFILLISTLNRHTHTFIHALTHTRTNLDMLLNLSSSSVSHMFDGSSTRPYILGCFMVISFSTSDFTVLQFTITLRIIYVIHLYTGVPPYVLTIPRSTHLSVPLKYG